jgi:hypothetical protein
MCVCFRKKNKEQVFNNNISAKNNKKRVNFHCVQNHLTISLKTIIYRENDALSKSFFFVYLAKVNLALSSRILVRLGV